MSVKSKLNKKHEHQRHEKPLPGQPAIESLGKKKPPIACCCLGGGSLSVCLAADCCAEPGEWYAVRPLASLPASERVLETLMIWISKLVYLCVKDREGTYVGWPACCKASSVLFGRCPISACHALTSNESNERGSMKVWRQVKFSPI